ncbi:hypothetical protein [Herbaspirillum sp. CF444]|uniref:hypothetical protein n=1 Tax=Herbaspirillum sp. CF444 TaxID=1144319 RepID=UPI0012F94CC0|nr:hypothetical protein [Herbaspirillum sp. CF444]
MNVSSFLMKLSGHHTNLCSAMQSVATKYFSAIFVKNESNMTLFDGDTAQMRDRENANAPHARPAWMESTTKLG